jgi:hypothetical protein
LVDFVAQDSFDHEESQIQAEADKRAKEIMDKNAGKFNPVHSSVIFKKR